MPVKLASQVTHSKPYLASKVFVMASCQVIVHTSRSDGNRKITITRKNSACRTILGTTELNTFKGSEKTSACKEILGYILETSAASLTDRTNYQQPTFDQQCGTVLSLMGYSTGAGITRFEIFPL